MRDSNKSSQSLQSRYVGGGGGGGRGHQESIDVGCYCNCLRCFKVSFPLCLLLAQLYCTTLVIQIVLTDTSASLSHTHTHTHTTHTTHHTHQGLNVALFLEKVNFQEYIPVVPTSAITGDGMGDLIALLVNYSQRVLSNQLMLSQELEAMVMEVRTS